MARGSPYRLPRRLRFHRSGWALSTGAIGIGLSAILTGNNLLFLVLGAMLGMIGLSGSLSELVLRRVRVERRTPRAAVAGRPAQLGYELRNGSARLPSFSLEIGERGDGARGFVAALGPGAAAAVRVQRVWPERGVYPLDAVTVGTSFPFGFFRKERDLECPGEVVVWPRTTRPVREARPAGDRVRRSEEAAAGASGSRGEYRGLRPYRPGDDPRDVHWRSSARSEEPLVREYARDQAQTLWICLDLREAPGAEAAVETAAALAARAAQRGQPFGLATSDLVLGPGSGPAQLERLLDALARARFRPGARPPAAPVAPAACVLVAAAAATSAAGWGDVFIAAEEP